MGDAGTVVMFAAAVVILAGLAIIPGRIARKRGHPSADAINVCGWLIFIFPIAWIVGLVWALSIPRVEKARGFEVKR